MEPALALALVLAGFATAIGAAAAKLIADVCEACAEGDEEETRGRDEWVAVDMPGGTLAVARRA